MDLASATEEQVVSEAAARWREMCAAQARLLDVLREIDSRDAWETRGAYCMPHWVSFTFGLSYWRADRWMQVADALPSLPRISRALAEGELPIYKVEELVRFATPEEEDALVEWASEVPSGAIREEAERRRHVERHEAESAEEARAVRWRPTEDGRSFEMYANLPSADGALVVDVLDRIAEGLPDLAVDPSGRSDKATKEQLRADALVALAKDASGGRALGGGSVNIHAPLDALLDNEAARTAGWTDTGAVIAQETIQRLLCDSSVKMLVQDATGVTLGVGRTTRVPTRGMVRQLRRRDRRCVFPNCRHSRYTQAHHIRWWSQGGGTDLDNLVLLCTFHHKLVHEYRWSLRRDAVDGIVRWFLPDGRRYTAGPRAA